MQAAEERGGSEMLPRCGSAKGEQLLIRQAGGLRLGATEERGLLLGCEPRADLWGRDADRDFAIACLQPWACAHGADALLTRPYLGRDPEFPRNRNEMHIRLPVLVYPIPVRD